MNIIVKFTTLAPYTLSIVYRRQSINGICTSVHQIINDVFVVLENIENNKPIIFQIF